MKQKIDNKRLVIRMSLLFLVSIVSCLLLAPRSTDAYSFYRDLKLGDVGEDVRELQVALNANATTRVADVGAGSPGQETDFFGELTKQAVIRLQNLHAGAVLEPVGLSVGTGFVGPLTRGVLAGTGEDTTSAPTVSAVSPLSTAVVASAATSTQPPPASSLDFDERQIPGSKELFKAVIRADALKANLSEEGIAQIEASIDEQAMVALPDLMTEFQKGRSQFDDATRTPDVIFEDAQQKAPIKSLAKKSAFVDFVRPLLAILMPIQTAQAQGALQSVGGFITYRYLCTCSYTWIMLIVGLPTIGTIDYEIGTQAHLNYSLPFARQILGLSTRVPTCVMYIYPSCISIPSTYGILSPLVGSSY